MVTPPFFLRLVNRSVEFLLYFETCSSGDAMKTNLTQSQKSPFRFGIALVVAMGIALAIFRMTKENYGSIVGLFVSGLTVCTLAMGLVCMLTLGSIMLLTSTSKPKATLANL